MSLVVVGLKNRTMPLNLFESFAVSNEDLPKALLSVKSRRHISEAVLLSTCNRTEVYVFAEKFHGAYQDIRDFLSDLSDLSADQFNDYLYVHYEDEAVNHLFSVTCGLDSAVLGENEIQHQVKVAWQAAQIEDTCGATINAAFRRALEVGKRIRTETHLTKQAPSIARSVIEMAEEHLQGLENKNIVILGAGEMGEGMASALSKYDTGKIAFSNRNFEKAEKAFKEFLIIHKDSKKIADAQYWLGRVYFAQKKFEEAALKKLLREPHVRYLRFRHEPDYAENQRPRNLDSLLPRCAGHDINRPI